MRSLFLIKNNKENKRQAQHSISCFLLPKSEDQKNHFICISILRLFPKLACVGTALHIIHVRVVLQCIFPTSRDPSLFTGRSVF